MALRDTIEQQLAFLVSTDLKTLRSIPKWPPDAFAVSALLLHCSGAYISVINSWHSANSGTWSTLCQKLGADWRNSWNTGGPIPTRISDAWELILKNRALLVESISKKPRLVKALILLVAAADEASAGIGILRSKPFKLDKFDITAFTGLYFPRNKERDSRSLCRQISASKLSVYPKLHTPKNGISIRSLTHHLALVPATEINTKWAILPWSMTEFGFNILLLPFPLSIPSKSFQVSQRDLTSMPDDFGFFTYTRPAVKSNYVEYINRCIRAAKRSAGQIHGVILPELALTESEVHRLARDNPSTLIIAGIARRKAAKKQTNEAMVVLGLPYMNQAWSQPKHHRWRIDAGQVLQYGIGGTLEVAKDWWENIDISVPRVLNFGHVNGWLTFCVLICEDLARQDPVSHIVRAIGPNLVIGLLLDGPQLESRWSARYATVLADDPGSAVLTLTSMGMIGLSNNQRSNGSRSVALWKDALANSAREISIGENAVGTVLLLNRQLREEWTADGRRDNVATAHITLAGTHEIVLD